ncbi:MAG: hypothetical protein ISS72_00395 [Candidatus Brocadiae bacterium]|nr:hypothetical protein [Candidatus Brocadiia bacterium]
MRRTAALVLGGALLLPLLLAAAARAGDADRLAQVRQKAMASDQEKQRQFSILLDQGRHFLQNNDYEQAGRVLAQAARLRPDDATCRRLVAEARTGLASAAKPDEILDRARAKWQGRNATLRRELDQSLFEAEQALHKGQVARAKQHARLALHGATYIKDAAVVSEFRSRAERILATADSKASGTAAAQRQAALDAKRKAARHQSSDALRSVRERGWAHLDKGQHVQALVAADEMLRLAPGNEQALFLKNEALKAKDKAEGVEVARKERKELRDDLLLRQLEQETTLPKDILEEKVVLSDKAMRQKHSVHRRSMEPWEQRLRAKLRDRITFEFNESSVTEACRYLAEVTESTILVDPAVAKSEKRLTLPKLKDLTFDHALKWVCRFWDATYVVRDHAILVTRRGGQLNEPIIRDYDVAGLLMPLRSIRTTLDSSTQLDDTGPLHKLTTNGKLDVKDEPITKGAIGEGWADFIRASVAPNTWDSGRARTLQQQVPRYTIQYRNGRIVVVHTPEVHEQIASLLENYRRARNLQVHILARILNIEMDYLQQIGVNFPGNLGDPDDPADDTFGYFDPREAPPNNPNRNWQRWEIAANIEHSHGVGEIPESFSEPVGGILVRYHYLNHTDVTAILNAVIKHRKGTLLIAPRLTCFNTQRANFQALTNYNYVRSISSDEEPEIGNVPDGIIFDVQPFISADRRNITLVLQPQLRVLRGFQSFSYINSLTGTRDRSVQLPTTELTSIATTVTVPDGGSLIVGGLGRVVENAGYASLPFFYAVPGVRYLLRDRRDAERRTSLNVLVTAEIVKDIFEDGQ